MLLLLAEARTAPERSGVLRRSSVVRDYSAVIANVTRERRAAEDAARVAAHNECPGTFDVGTRTAAVALTP
jgi:hypothetical protein